MVLKHFAIKSSKFLQAALNNDWKEAREKRVPLPEVNPIDFEAYLEWLYTSQLTPSGNETVSERGTTLVRLYVLGEFLDDAKFCNAIMDAFIATNDRWSFSLSGETIVFTWEKTSVGSPLRTAILEMAAAYLAYRDQRLKTFPNILGTDVVLLDLFKYLENKHGLSMSLRPNVTVPWEQPRDKCEFHRHNEANPKCPGSQSQ